MEIIPVGLCPGSVEVLTQGIAPEAYTTYGLVGHHEAVAKFIVLDLGDKVDSGPPGYIGWRAGTMTILCNYSMRCIQDQNEKSNKKITVTVRRVIIFLNIKASIADLITLLSSSVQTLKAVATPTAAIVVLTPAKNLTRFFGGF
jgi:hypothetical protein